MTKKPKEPASAKDPAPGKPAEILPLRAPRACPICGKESSRAAYPFCSKRCADIDLHRWFSGRYAIAAVEAPSPDGDGEDGSSG